MTELSVNDLHLDYGTGAHANPILKGVSMELQRGEVVALLGPSGSGKTTFAARRGRAGIAQMPVPSTSGSAGVFDGARNFEMPAEERNLGLVFQSYALWPHKTVADNVAYGLKLRKTPSGEIATRVKAVLSQLGLGHLGERYPHQLSGGQQQRVAIARALVYNPQVILLDEPLSNLDAKLREEARAFLRELIVRLGLSALMVTHDQGEAMAISDRILLLNNGRIEQQGTPQSMYQAPNTLFTAEFMGSNNKLAAEVLSREGERVTVKLDGGTAVATLRGRSDVRPGEQLTGIIRVEQVRISGEASDNAIRLPLSTCMYLGDRWECLFKVDGGPAGSVGLRAYAPQRLDQGEYWLSLPEQSLWAF
uniref:ABC-type spermidine/putrescine transport systems, ATPase component protein n=1 Tax=Herbaspirillum seropedicae TaxID=964 RepID=A2RQ39_HERSE|nr:ABC-type spermidine/putrescine transport systems, ATPase component protein [Herbaspirillum seropedicae]